MNILKYSNNNNSNNILSLGFKFYQQQLNYSTQSRVTPSQKIFKDSKNEFNRTRNAVSLYNFYLPEYVDNLKKSITPSLLDKSTEHVYEILPGLKLTKFSFDNRNDAIRFQKEANDHIETVKEEYIKKVLEKSDEALENEHNNRKKRLNEYFKNSTKKISTIKKKANTPKPEALIKISTIDPLFDTSDEYIDSLPTPNLNLNVQLVEFQEDVENGVRSLLNGKLPHQIKKEDNIILGFDCDWSALSKYLSGEYPKVSIISLSNGEKTVLFRICNFGLDKDDYLGQLLNSENIMKTGFRTHSDSNKIFKDFGFLPNNVTDLSYSKQAIIAIGKQTNAIGLDRVVAALFGFDIKRSRTLKLSNWATSKGLSKEQIDSASYNAYFSLKAHFKVEELPSDIYSSLDFVKK